VAPVCWPGQGQAKGVRMPTQKLAPWPNGHFFRGGVEEAEVTEGVRLENPTAPETIDPHLTSSVRSQSLTDELEAGEEPIKRDRTR